MELVARADVVLALGTRLNPFSRPCPATASTIGRKRAKVIQVDINADRIGLTKPVAVGISGDAKLVACAASFRCSRPPPAISAAPSAEGAGP